VTVSPVRLAFEPVQFDAYKAIAPGMTVGLGWGRGGGKSKFQRLQWYLSIAEWDGRYRPQAPTSGVRWALLMPTLEQAKKVHAEPMEAELTGSGEWAFLGAHIDHSQWRVTFPGGSWIQWVTAERARNVRGMRCDGLSVDECDDVDPDIYDAILRPWFTEHHSLGIKILSGTPTRGRYGLLYRTKARAEGRALNQDGKPFERHHFSHATSYEFPHYVKPEAVEEARKEITPQLFAREWLCDFDAAEGLVYPHFREDFHVRQHDPDTRWREYIIGVDWGFEDPAVINVFGIAGGGKDITIHQIDEVYVQHKTDSELAEVAKRLEVIYPAAKWYADPSRPQSIESLRREARVRIVQAENAIEDGVATVADALLVRERPDKSQWAQLYVDPCCVNTIREYGLYRRKRDARNPDRVLDAIEDKNNHAMDATRYALFTHLGGSDRRLISGYGVV
jgi:hypothetical protein